MESLTKSNIVVIDALYIVVGILLVVTYWVNFKPTVLDICLWFVFGLVSWSFFEYFLHRFLYHKIKDASYDTGFQYLFHGIHHKYPHDNDRLVLPVVPSLILAALFLSVFYLVLKEEALVYGAGFLIGYLIYINIHWMVHKKTMPKGKLKSWWWKHHNIHHYQQPDKAFGVSSPVWDILFGTMPIKGRKTVTILVDKKKTET